MARMTVPTGEVLKALQEIGISQWVGGRWIPAARGRLGARRPPPRSTTAQSAAATRPVSPSEAVGMIGIAVATATTVALALGGADEASRPLGALKRVLENTAREQAVSRQTLGRTIATLGTLLCGVGALALCGALVSRRVRRQR